MIYYAPVIFLFWDCLHKYKAKIKSPLGVFISNWELQFLHFKKGRVVFNKYLHTSDYDWSKKGAKFKFKSDFHFDWSKKGHEIQIQKLFVIMIG